MVDGRSRATEPSGVAQVDPARPFCTLERAILQTLAYADIFDYALTAAEIQRYLVGLAAPLAQVEAALADGGRLVPGLIVCSGAHFALYRRQITVELRHARAELARLLWPRAIRYARCIANLPFVQMVAVTGALAVDNVVPGADIDYMIITEPGRLWVCRALIIGLVRLARQRGDIICPNYLLSARALALPDHTLYTAHELAQMVPVSGHALYRRLRQANRWADGLLPNAAGLPRLVVETPRRGRLVRGGAEALLRSPLGSWIEGWEMQRKVRKLSMRIGGESEAAFCADWCKGHFGGHGQRTIEAYQRRLAALGLPGDEL